MSLNEFFTISLFKEIPNHFHLIQRNEHVEMNNFACKLSQNALKRDCSGKCIEWVEGHYLEVVVEV